MITLVLRPFTMVDANEEYWRSLRDPEVNRHLDSRPWNYTAAGLEKRLAELEAGAGWMFAIGANAAIGTCTIRYEGEPSHGVAVLGLLLFKRWWGMGLGKATIMAATDKAFGELGLRKLWAGVHEPNIASRRAFENAGWREEGVFREHRLEYRNNEIRPVDVIHYAAWRDQWPVANAEVGGKLSMMALAYPDTFGPAA